MRKPFVAGNWKMNKTVDQACKLVEEMLPALQKIDTVETVICPPFTSLMPVSKLLAGSGIGLGAQDMHWEASGAFTGAISPSMVKECCNYVILGHSERRAYFGETDEIVNRKLKAALQNDLVPIVCVGERLEENEAGITNEVISRQLRGCLQDIPAGQAEKIVIAYEPVWAIGTGRAASPAGAQAVVLGMISPTLISLFNEKVAQAVRVLYGGSVTAGNASEFFSQDGIDGALVGGASLKTAEFVQIIQAAHR